MLRIVVTSGPEKGRSLDSNELKEIEIGRQARHLRLTDGRVSRVHCCLEKNDAGTWFLADRHSKHGTSHNGRLLTGRVRVEDGDRINIGHTVIRCFISKPVVVADDPRMINPAKPEKPAKPATASSAKQRVQPAQPAQSTEAKSAPREQPQRVRQSQMQASEVRSLQERTTVEPVSTTSKKTGEAAADCWMDAIMSEMEAFEEEEREIEEESNQQ